MSEPASPSAPRSPENPHLSRVLEHIATVSQRAHRVAGDLSPAQLAWRPPNGGWGVGLCLEHLTTAAEEYLTKVEPALERRRRAGGEPTYAGWGHSLAGKLLLHFVRGKRKVPAPRVFRPSEESRPDALDAFLATQDRTAGIARRADGLDLERVRFASPASPLLRLHLGDALILLQDHADRHLAQAERVRRQEAFPV